MRHAIVLLVILFGLQVVAQTGETSNLEATYFYGNIYRHKDDIGHLIKGHPSGVILAWNQRTYGDKEWQSAFNYPDYGFSFQYEDLANKYLGKTYAIGAHYNFYGFGRRLMFRISQGIAMTTNPYDKETNFKNNAFGSRFMSSNLFMLQYSRERVWRNFGFRAGIALTHFSNGRFKSPNSGINTFAASASVVYDLGAEREYVVADTISKDHSERIKYNIAVRTGISESPVAHSGQKPFYHIGLYADKRIGRKSALQLGADVFFSMYLKDYIEYMSVAFPELPPVDPDTDYKRVAVIAGHELFINRLSIETQVGYYVYKPFDYEIDFYQRLGTKYYISDKWFAALSLKSHAARAEAIELGIGIRL